MRRVFRVAAPSIRIVPWAARASCWPLPQQLLPVSAAGGGRRCCSGRIILNFGVQKRLRAFLYPFFTGGVVKANGSCRACFLRKQARRGAPSPSQSPLVTALPKGEPLAWRHSFRLNCKVCGFARASPFGRGGIASAMTERASPLPGGVFRPKFHVLGRKSQTIKQSAQKGGAKFGEDAFDRS